eukprot:7049115-Lingulodinium_polyedra.AAC.1
MFLLEDVEAFAVAKVFVASGSSYIANMVDRSPLQWALLGKVAARLSAVTAVATKAEVMEDLRALAQQ